MKKAILVLVAVLMTAPAMADVDITASADVDGNTAVITISYNANGAAVRAIALDITLVGDAIIMDVNCVNDEFTMYPGNINIAGDGTINDYGSCLCDSSYPGTLGGLRMNGETGAYCVCDGSDPEPIGLDTNGVTIEMASMHVGAANAPADSGDLVEITILGCNRVDLNIALNAIRGGVVLEDPDEAVTEYATGLTGIDLDGCHCHCPPPPSCWNAWCAGQPFGDATCDGNVDFLDLAAVKIGFFESRGDPDYNCCADFNQDNSINFIDLGILKANFFTSGHSPSTGAQNCPY